MATLRKVLEWPKVVLRGVTRPGTDEIYLARDDVVKYIEETAENARKIGAHSDVVEILEALAATLGKTGRDA